MGILVAHVMQPFVVCLPLLSFVYHQSWINIFLKEYHAVYKTCELLIQQYFWNLSKIYIYIYVVQGLNLLEPYNPDSITTFFTDPDWNIWTSQRKYPANIHDLLNFPLTPPWVVKMSWHLFNWLPLTLVYTFISPSEWIVITLVMPEISILLHSPVKFSMSPTLWFMTTYMQN